MVREPRERCVVRQEAVEGRLELGALPPGVRRVEEAHAGFASGGYGRRDGRVADAVAEDQ